MEKSLNVRKPRYSERSWSVRHSLYSRPHLHFLVTFRPLPCKISYYLLFSRFRRGSLILSISQKNGTIAPPNLNPENFTKFTGA